MQLDHNHHSWNYGLRNMESMAEAGNISNANHQVQGRDRLLLQNCNQGLVLGPN